MEKPNILVTVFTPTYNRGHLLHKLYESLLLQTIKSFEWLVVDDGSSDNTKELFEEWSKQVSQICIRYIKKENGGKARAINMGIQEDESIYFFRMIISCYMKYRSIIITSDRICNPYTGN